ncbi:MAG: 2-oxoglutarate dehydrogenase complex dihydrolipoyllysine-residue succinyltransferase [Myxococcaceae bacterium]
MALELKVPQLGESITEAVVGKWHKRVGEAVKADEPVVVLETDKVTIDVQAPSAGALQAIAMPEGSKVRIGEVLGTIEPGAAGATAAPAAAVPVASKPVPPMVSGNGKPQATPVARAVAADKGIDVSKLPGTGTGGRVTKDDVLKANAPLPNPSAPHAPSMPGQQLRSAPGAREERVTLSPLRRRVAERLLQAQSTAAILTTFNEVDMSAVMELRKRYQERFEKKHGVKLGFMSFFVKAAVNALQQFPAVNASLEGDEVVFHHYYDIGVAVSGSRGLVVPVVRGADELSMAELEKTIADYGLRARNDKLTLPELQGGTFTISNGGIFGSMLSTPILNPPQTGILGMHNIVERPVARDGQVVIRPVMYLALSYDHRLIDGREAVQFLVRIKDCIEDPERILLEI